MATTPLIFTAVYQTRQFGAQSLYTPSSPSVYGSLANPPATGVSSETAQTTHAQALNQIAAVNGGGTLPKTPNPFLMTGRTKAFDSMRDFYDEASIFNQVPTPGGLAAGTVTATGFTLTWTAVPNATTYKVEQSVSPWQVWTTIGTPTAATLAVTGLTTQTNYRYRVSAQIGQNWSVPSLYLPVTTS